MRDEKERMKDEDGMLLGSSMVNRTFYLRPKLIPHPFLFIPHPSSLIPSCDVPGVWRRHATLRTS